MIGMPWVKLWMGSSSRLSRIRQPICLVVPWRLCFGGPWVRWNGTSYSRCSQRGVWRMQVGCCWSAPIVMHWPN